MGEASKDQSFDTYPGMEKKWEYVDGWYTMARATAQGTHRMMQNKLKLLSSERWNGNRIIKQHVWWSTAVVFKVMCAHPKGCTRRFHVIWRRNIRVSSSTYFLLKNKRYYTYQYFIIRLTVVYVCGLEICNIHFDILNIFY